MPAMRTLAGQYPRAGYRTVRIFLARQAHVLGVARAVLKWLLAAQIETAFIDPGKPWQNGVDESFNGKFRNEHLSLEWFRNRADAVVSIEHWRRHDNEVRPHSSLAYRTPHEFKAITETTTTTGRSAAAPPRAAQDGDRADEPNVLTNPQGAILQ